MPVYNTSTSTQDKIKEKIWEVLDKADSNKDGRFTKAELKKAFEDFGAFIPAWRASRCLAKVDINHDGQISGEELDSLVEYVRARYKIKN